MAVKLRLRRQGRKGTPFYHIVASDARTPRDGKYLEKIGSYDPTRNPAEIIVDSDSALRWLQNGAQPTNTVRAILRYTGVNLRHALIKQGKDQETIDRIFNKWKEEKEAKIQAKRDRLQNEAESDTKKRLAAETKIKEARAAAISAKNRPPAAPTQAPESDDSSAEDSAGETE